MLRFGWGGVLVFCESFFNEAGYAGVEGSVVVVPFESNADIFASGPVDCDVVPLLQGVFEVNCMFVALEFDSKIIYYQGEGDRAPDVSPKPRCELARVVAGAAQAFDQEFIGYFAGLW